MNNLKPVIIDAHCDTITEIGDQGLECNSGHFDLVRMRKAGVKMQFFAVFVSPKFKGRELEKVLEYTDLYYEELEKSNDILPILNSKQLKYCLDSEYRGGILAIEGGEVLNGNLSVLRILYRLGVRCLTLTWNNRNLLGDGIGENSANSGLSDFGVEVVQEMNRLGMIIDVSHLSEKGFWDVLELSRQPVIASHSNAYGICKNKRNLSDKQIKALAEKGGVIGVNFVPQFVSNYKPDLEQVLNHVDYIASLAGTDCLALGSDFDGVEKTVPGLEDVSKLTVLHEKLSKRGVCKEDVEKILGENLLRVMQQVMN